MPVLIPINGHVARITKEKLHPLTKANINPDIVIENARIRVLTFSPKDF